MMVTLGLGTIGVHFFCFRAINDVACLVEESFKIGSISREVVTGKLAAKRASYEDSFVANLIPDAQARLQLVSELCEGREITPHEAYDLSQAPDALLSLTYGLCGPRDFLGLVIERGKIEAKGDALCAVLADIALPIGAIAPMEQTSLDKTREVTTHRGAGHTIQALTDRLVRGEDDHLGVPAK